MPSCKVSRRASLVVLHSFIAPALTSSLLFLLSLQHACCGPCWNGYLCSKLLDGSVLHIRCPHAHPTPCKRVLDSAEVQRRLLTQLSREQYQRRAELARIAQDPSVRWCPTANCETLLRGGSEEQPHLTCEKCKAELCFHCSERWHPSTSCAEASAASLQQLLGAPSLGATSNAEEIKRCPSCGTGIIREHGCNYLRCSRCTFEFCWLCLSQYSEHHFSWWNLRGCPLLHLDRFSWLADDRCCGMRCSCGCGCAGILKRTCLRVLLAFVYLLLFLVALPFLLLLSPYLIYRYVHGAPRRAHRRELKVKNERMLEEQRRRQLAQPSVKPPSQAGSEQV